MFSPRPTVQRAPGATTLLLSTAFAGLSAGALWCLLALGLPRGAEFLIVPLGAAIGAYFHWLGFVGARGATCAAASVLIAFVYAQYLFAAVRVAQVLGFSLRATLFKMDLGLAWQGVLANLGAWDLVWLALACVIGAWLPTRISVRD